MKLRAERLFVEVNVNTIYRCFLANAPRRTRHLPGRLKGSVTQLAVAVRVYCSFVDPGQNGRLGNWQETQNRRPTAYWAFIRSF